MARSNEVPPAVRRFEGPRRCSEHERAAGTGLNRYRVRCMWPGCPLHYILARDAKEAERVYFETVEIPDDAPPGCLVERLAD